MDGGDALAFARNRNINRGDFARTENQGILLLAGLAKLRGEQADSVSILESIAVLARHVRLDGLSLTEAYRLGRLAVSLDPAAVRSVVVPGTATTVGGASVVLVDPAAEGLFADFRDDGILQSH